METKKEKDSLVQQSYYLTEEQIKKINLQITYLKSHVDSKEQKTINKSKIVRDALDLYFKQYENDPTYQVLLKLLISK